MNEEKTVRLVENDEATNLQIQRQQTRRRMANLAMTQIRDLIENEDVGNDELANLWDGLQDLQTLIHARKVRARRGW